MNKWFLTAGVMMAGTAGLHVFGGGPEIHVPIQGSELPPYLRAISAVLWHAVTVVLLVFAAAYLWATRSGDRFVVVVMGLVQVGFSALFLYYGMALLGSVWPMPQWIIFLSIPAVSAMGLRRRATNSQS